MSKLPNRKNMGRKATQQDPRSFLLPQLSQDRLNKLNIPTSKQVYSSVIKKKQRNKLLAKAIYYIQDGLPTSGSREGKQIQVLFKQMLGKNLLGVPVTVEVLVKAVLLVIFNSTKRGFSHSPMT